MQTNQKHIIVLLVLLFITSLTSYATLHAQEEKFVVVLDAGHGGHDSGNVGMGTVKKILRLK